MKISNKTATGLILALGIVLVVLLAVIFFGGKREGFQGAATGPQLLCAIEYAKKNPNTVMSKNLKNYIDKFDTVDARTKQTANANFVLRKVQADGQYGTLNDYYIRVRTSLVSCMQETYAIPPIATKSVVKLAAKKPKK